MALKFRLRGLAETFIENLCCPGCGHEATSEEDSEFSTELTKVTLHGIVVVIRCLKCREIFVPSEQRTGILNFRKLRSAVERDSLNTGQPIYVDRQSVELDVERMNAERHDKVH
jgi:hypothetical protein